MRTVDKKTLEAITMFTQAKEQLKQLEKAMDEYKAIIELKMGQEPVLEADEYICIRTACQRATLDRKGLERELGSETIKQFEKVTEFFKLEIKKVG